MIAPDKADQGDARRFGGGDRQRCWGPDGGDKPLRRIKTIEIAVTAGSGGTGSVWIDDLRLVALPVSSVVKNSANESVVWLHEQALVFRAVAVQPQALRLEGQGFHVA